MQLQIEPAGKILGRSVTFGPKSVENSSDLDNFFELTTPNDRFQSIQRETDLRVQGLRIYLIASALAGTRAKK